MLTATKPKKLWNINVNAALVGSSLAVDQQVTTLKSTFTRPAKLEPSLNNNLITTYY